MTLSAYSPASVSDGGILNSVGGALEDGVDYVGRAVEGGVSDVEYGLSSLSGGRRRRRNRKSKKGKKGRKSKKSKKSRKSKKSKKSKKSRKHRGGCGSSCAAAPVGGGRKKRRSCRK